MNSWKCPHCKQWIGAMEVHEDCARKQDEARKKVDAHLHRIADAAGLTWEQMLADHARRQQR